MTGRLAEQAQQRAQAMQDAVDIANTRATTLYLLTSQRMTLAGLTVDNLVSFGEDACALGPGGEAWCWGNNDYGQCNVPSPNSGSTCRSRQATS